MSDYSSIGYGYDEFSSPVYRMDGGYNKKLRKDKPRTFKSRVAAKKGGTATKVSVSEPPVEQGPCNCIECMPRPVQPSCDCMGKPKKCGLFNQMTQQDCIIIFIILIVCIVLYSMYTMCQRMGQMMQRSFNYPNPNHPGLPT